MGNNTEDATFDPILRLKAAHSIVPRPVTCYHLCRPGNAVIAPKTSPQSINSFPLSCLSPFMKLDQVLYPAFALLG